MIERTEEREQLRVGEELRGYTRRHEPKTAGGILGNNAGTVAHPLRGNGWVYVRLHGDPDQVICARNDGAVPEVDDLPITMTWCDKTASGYYVIDGIASQWAFSPSVWNGAVAAHGWQHERDEMGEGSFDPVDVYGRALVPVRAQAQETPNLTVYLCRGFVPTPTELWRWEGGNSPPFTALVPSPFGETPQRWDLVYMWTDHTVQIAIGVEKTDGTAPDYPAVPEGGYPVAYVFRTTPQATITEDEILDARPIGCPIGGATGGAEGIPSTTLYIHDENSVGIAPWASSYVVKQTKTTAPDGVEATTVIGPDVGEYGYFGAITNAGDPALTEYPAGITTAKLWYAVHIDNPLSYRCGVLVRIYHNNDPMDYDDAGTGYSPYLYLAADATVAEYTIDIACSAVPMVATDRIMFYPFFEIQPGWGGYVHVTLYYDGATHQTRFLVGGSSAAAGHALLSATHTDTLTGTVVDGDVIIGNATPKWSRLARSVPAANVRNVLGIDNGETRPAWKAALDATNPTTIAYSDAPAPGTSLLFAHRDHRHGMAPASGGADTAAADIYIATTGNDTTGDGTVGNPYATLAKAMTLLPTVLEVAHTIHVADGTYAEAIDIQDRVSADKSKSLKITGNTTTPANVTFTGTCTNGLGTATTGAAITGPVWVELEGLRVNVTAGRGIMAYAGARLDLDRVTVTGTIDMGIHLWGYVDCYLHGNITVTGFADFGIHVQAHSRMYYWTAGTLTITGPTGDAWGIAISYQSAFHVGAIAVDITITEVKYGIQASLNSIFQHYFGSGTITIDNAATPADSIAAWCNDVSTFSTNHNCTIDHFATAFFCASEAYMEVSGTNTVTNITTRYMLYQNSVIVDGASLVTYAGSEQVRDLTETAAPATPASGHAYLYVKSDGKIYSKDDAGTEYDLTAGASGSVATDAIWDAKGDLAVGTGANTAAKLTVGANGTIPVADSTQATGIKWDTVAGTGDVTYAQLLAMQLCNEIKGWPPCVNTGDLAALNLWFDSVSTPTTAPSVVAVSGEAGITEDYELALKVITDGANEGLSQRFTYADEPRVKSGRKLSTLWAIWCVGGVGATLSIINSSSEETAAAKVTAAAWTVVEVADHTLAGTYCDIKIITDGAGTFYAVPLGANIGARGLALRPRGLRRVDTHVALTSVLNNQDPEATWTDVDVTGVTSNLAVAIEGIGYYHNTSNAGKGLKVRRNGDTSTVGVYVVQNPTNSATDYTARALIPLDDAQIFEYVGSDVGGDAEGCSVAIAAYWEWE